MKRLLILAMFLLIAASASAATVTLAWDPAPTGEDWTQVRAYEHSGTTYTQVGSVACTPTAQSCTTLTLANVATGTHSYVVRSYNGQSESVNSNEVTGIVLTTPKSPTTITITITVP